mmetsp:Transcript_4492/g.14932  ORF Transcript_4492/g.14932 Transcript_4492/m.14932 type:complete len:508 (+) Transcript_4492:33-1556(+)
MATREGWMGVRTWCGGHAKTNPRANRDGDTRPAARGGAKLSTTAAQRRLRSSTPTSEGEVSAATDSEAGFAEGRGPCVTEAEGFVVVDLTQLCANDLENALADWWASNILQYRGRRVIEIVVQRGFEQAAMRALEMMPSKPTVEIEEEGKLYVKLQGAHKTLAYSGAANQFTAWAGNGSMVGTEVDQKPGQNSEVRHDILLHGQRPPPAETTNPASPPCLRVANVPGEVVYAEDAADVKRALHKVRKMLDRARRVFFDTNGAKKSFADYESTPQDSHLARMFPFVFLVIALPKDGLLSPELRERLGATGEDYRELAASAARNKVQRPSTGGITDARDAASDEARRAFDDWSRTPGYDAAVAKNAAAKAAIALRKNYNTLMAAHDLGAIREVPDDPFPIPTDLPTDPRAELSARLRIPRCNPQLVGRKYVYPTPDEAPWIGLFRYDQPFTEGKYYRCVPGETLYVPVPGVVVGRGGDTNGLGNAADGGYGHHIFPLRFDELLAEVYGL